MKIIYLLLVAAALLFAIQYRPALSVALLISLLAFPPVLAILCFCAAKRMSAELEIKGGNSSTGQDIPMKLTIRNPTFIPVGCAEVLLEVSVSSSAKPEKVRINTPVFPKNNQVLTTAFSSEHFGIVNVRLKSVKVCDMLKLTRFKLRKKAVTFTESPIVILPVPVELSSSVADYSDSGLESDIYSDSKAGDDPSEIFAIRDYKDGDKMSRIHWKLTAKEDKLMVKDYSLPLCDSCLIIADTYSPPDDPAAAMLYDTVIETTVSISMLLNDKFLRHRIACYDRNSDELTEMPVYSDDDYLSTSAKLIACGICERGGLAAEAELMIENTGLRFGHLLLICTQIDERVISALADSGMAVKYTVLLCTPPDRTGDNIRLPQNLNTETVQVVCGDISASLADVTF